MENKLIEGFKTFKSTRQFVTGIAVLILLNLFLGMMMRDWVMAGFPMKMDYLCLYMLTPPLLLFDGLMIYGVLKKSNNKLFMLIYCIANIAAVVVGIYLGFPKT